jgi:hypothetical protein
VNAAPTLAAGEAALAARWAAGLRGPLRLEDGRPLRVIFPGVPGPGAGPDFRGAILDAGGDVLRGDVEVHLAASGWRRHGHARDAAYHGVVLHVVGRNDGGAAVTGHRGRAIPVLVLPPLPEGFPPPFTPPCAFAPGRLPVAERLQALGVRRLRMKAAALQPQVAARGAGPALYAALLETLGGPTNRDAFAALARMLPLPALLERLGPGVPRSLAAAAHLKGAEAGVVLRRAGLRPLAAPGRRLDAAGALVARLWPGGAPGWPLASPVGLPERLRVPGLGRGLAIELAVNAVLPVALAAGAWPEEDVLAAYRALPSPGTYGRLRPLERWLGGGARPFASAAALQGGLLLHRDYCTAGRCGRCPLSP